MPVVWFGDEDLRRLAGGRSYERGVGYVGAVGDLDELPDGVVGTVHGTEPYRVRLRDRGGSLDGACTCPYGQDGAFCKHCVAVGLVLLADAPTGRPKQRRRRTAATVDLRGYLVSVDPAELVDLVLDLAADDPALHRRLSLRAATHGAPDVKELRRLVGALRARGFLDYSRSFDYAKKANDVLDTIGASHAAAVGPLYRLTIQHITKTTEQGDDSSGVIGDALARAVDGYASACRAAPPDPVELATWMIDFHLHRRAGTDFTGYLAELKEVHRRKTTFLAELTRAGL